MAALYSLKRMIILKSIWLRFPEGKRKALTLSYDDGVEQDIRLLELMAQHGVKGTFNINSGGYAAEGTVYPHGQISRRMSKSQCTQIYNSPFAEVAVHALTHAFLNSITPAMVMKEIIQDRENLENQFGKIIRGMAYPYGTYNDMVVQVLDQAGIAYARTVHSHLSFDMPSDWLRMGATCHHKNPQLMQLAEKFLNETPERDPYLFYLWGHSFEFDKDNNWNVIEEFLKTAGGRDDIWYATNIEIYDYNKAFENLQYSVDGRFIHNPSAISVWVQIDKDTIEIPAGQNVKLK